MAFEKAERLKRLPPYLFQEIDRLKAELMANGVDVINLGVGDPDLPTPKHIIERLKTAAEDPSTHQYPAYSGMNDFRVSVARWYGSRFGVELDPLKEVLTLIGSKEGIAHLGLAVLNRGDSVLVPNTTYPIHHYSVIIAGGKLVTVPILEGLENFLRNLDSAFRKTRPRPKVVILNFPHNPTTISVDPEFFRDVVKWAKKNQVLVVHDLAYADITYDGYEAPSFLSVKGAKDVGIEVFTMSKSYNMAGWRIGFAAGNPKVIASLARIKSYMDYGIFTPIQVAAITALDSPFEDVRRRALVYQERRDILCEGLNRMGWPVEKPRAAMYLWTSLPPRFRDMSSMDFSMMLLKKAGVAVSPGTGFGDLGEGYIRIAMVENKDRIRQALRNIRTLFH